MSRATRPSPSASNRRGGAASLDDVAERAGVSRATAARALGGYGKVSAATLERVTAAASALNYRTNELARAFRAGRSRTIGLIIADISNSFFDRTARAIIDRAAQSGYQVLVAHTDDVLETERRAVQVLIDKRVDGLIVAASSPREYAHLTPAASHHFPALVLLDRRIPDLRVDTVSTNDYASAKEVARLFVGKGHERLGLLVSSTGPVGVAGEYATVSSVDDRVSGFCDEVRAAGLTMIPERLRYSSADPVESVAAAYALLSVPNRPTAVMATNSTMALALIDACRQLDLVVGKDVSLVSFDDSDWAKVFVPPISVVERPIYELGAGAVELLLDQIETDRVEARWRQLDNRLVDRSSVAVLTRAPTHLHRTPPHAEIDVPGPIPAHGLTRAGLQG